jgi:hypothetical protein
MRLKPLEDEGLFDPERKRALPERPRRIGIATSATGAALQDMLNTLRRRYPLAEVLLAPCAVQGDDAPLQIVAALGALNRLSVDVILLARGGGSLEDLWASMRTCGAQRGCFTAPSSPAGARYRFHPLRFCRRLRAPTPNRCSRSGHPRQGRYNREIKKVLRRIDAAFLDVLPSGSALSMRWQPNWRRNSPRGGEQRPPALDALIETLWRNALHNQALRRIIPIAPVPPAGAQSMDCSRAFLRGSASGQVVRSAGQLAPGDACSTPGEWFIGARVDDIFPTRNDSTRGGPMTSATRPVDELSYEEALPSWNPRRALETATGAGRIAGTVRTRQLFAKRCADLQDSAVLRVQQVKPTFLTCPKRISPRVKHNVNLFENQLLWTDTGLVLRK